MVNSQEVLTANVVRLARELGIGPGRLAKAAGNKPPWGTMVMKGQRQVTLKQLPKLAEFFQVSPEVLLPYDSFDNTKKATARTSPVAPERGITTPPTEKAGGHGLTPSAQRRRIEQLEGFLGSLLKLTETKVVEMRGVLHAGQPGRAARKKA